MVYFLVFIFGAIIGSFLNVVALRYNTGQSIISKSSYCFSCGKKLSCFELIPIFSFFIQKGRCEKCGSKISWQYPIVEALTGLIFTLIFYKIFNSQFLIFNLIYYWVIFSILIIISVYDFRHQIIPNGLVYAFIVLSFFSVFWKTPTLLVGAPTLSVGVENFDVAIRFLAGIGFGAFFGLLWLMSRGRWMGFGDAKLALGIGWLLGFSKGFMAILFSFWLGALVSAFLLLFRPKNFTMKSRIPFGPFLCLGAFLAFLLGSEISKLYWFF